MLSDKSSQEQMLKITAEQIVCIVDTSYLVSSVVFSTFFAIVNQPGITFKITICIICNSTHNVFCRNSKNSMLLQTFSSYRLSNTLMFAATE